MPKKVAAEKLNNTSPPNIISARSENKVNPEVKIVRLKVEFVDELINFDSSIFL